MTKRALLVPVGLLAAVLALAAVVATGLVEEADSADHLDAPGLTSPRGDGRLDINDIYAFQSPTDASKTVFIMTVNPAAGVLSPTEFKPGGDAGYELRIDNDGDAIEDKILRFNFSAVEPNGRQSYRLRMFDFGGGNIEVLANGEVGQPAAFDGGMAMAGVFDDPFFFDLNGFLGNSFCAVDPSEDFFAGLDVSGLVVEIPSDWITDGDSQVAVWARTRLGGEQVDRMGIPALNTVFIPTDQKNRYNELTPLTDQAIFGEFFGPFETVLLPDLLGFDTASTDGFPNGRRLADDVIDIELQLITGDALAGDCVDDNDVPYRDTFPYLAAAHSAPEAS